LKLARWDIRREDEDPESFESFKNSITEHGLFNPLTVARMSNSDKFTIMAGKRRFKAVKELGWKQIPVNVLLEDATETDIRIIKINENLQRDELKDLESSFAILAAYETAGYTDQQAIYGTKKIDNMVTNLRNGSTYDERWDEIQTKLANSKSIKGGILDIDENFVNICRSIALQPKYQYQLLQIVVQLDPDVLVEAQKIGLTKKKKMLLTHSKLKGHPQLQKDLIKDIATKTDKEAAHTVRQKVTDLETGYIKKVGNQYWINGVPTRDKIPKSEKKQKEDVDKPASDFKIVKASHELIRILLGGRALTHGEYEYNKNIIDKNTEAMYKIVKSCNVRQLISIEQALGITEYTIKEMLKIVGSELNIKQEKEKLTSK
jgi:ParB/RepB/Spo0J family partition protein